MIDIEEIAGTVGEYLIRHPGERERLAELSASLEQRTAITARSTFTGHATCSAVLINSEGHVLHIRHNTLGLWVPPGGHLEPSDANLIDAALREASEEAGISADHVTPLYPYPIDIDVHFIPDNPRRGEPGHWHFEFAYAFAVTGTPELTLQLEEVSDARWVPVDEVQWDELRAKLQQLT